MIKLIATFLEVTKTTQNDSQLKIYCKLINILEFLNTEHALTMATIWRYVYNDYYKTETSSMYAGLLLDKLEALLSKISKSPLDAFKVSTLSHEHLPKEVSNVISMNKTFCNFFDRTNEYAARHALVHSGSKIADILECANFATKTIVYEKCIENLFTAKYVYFFKRSWFIAFPMEDVLETSRKTKQKMMHLRLRRMVWAHNLMFMPQAQYDRECLIRPNGNVLEPHPNVYTGYGDKEDILFFYGVMNDGAYRLKYQDDLDDDDEERPEIIEGSPSDRVPNLGLSVELSIDCPIKYSPLKFLKSFPQEKIKSLKNNNEVCGTKIQLKCVWEGAKRLRLEEEYNYNFTSMI
ncbi:uncharacterized protein LOC109608816 isoform X2 [Aethina tumida]|nr:uncharacterized protein LOC109608816 isoform X2 [Aethina tumida]